MDKVKAVIMMWILFLFDNTRSDLPWPEEVSNYHSHCSNSSANRFFAALMSCNQTLTCSFISLRQNHVCCEENLFTAPGEIRKRYRVSDDCGNNFICMSHCIPIAPFPRPQPISIDKSKICK